MPWWAVQTNAKSNFGTRNKLNMVVNWNLSSSCTSNNCKKLQTSMKHFVLNNQPDALIIPILFCYKTLHVWASSSADHQEFPTVHLALVSFMQSGWNCNAVPSWLCLEVVIRNLCETYQCRMYSRKLLMIGTEDAHNM